MSNLRRLATLLTTTLALLGDALAEPSPEELRGSYERPAWIEFPENAPYRPEVATLGKMLFFDIRVSHAGNMSCATCHDPSFGWETPAPRAIGAMNVALARHAPSLQNLAEAPYLFWDGRAADLETQARAPITHPMEMGADMAALIERIGAIRDYRRWFDRAFPREGLTEQTLLRSIATYERTIQSGWAPFDSWVAGEEDAIPEAAIRGFSLFNGEAGCSNCHSGWNFTNHKFQDIGLPSKDLGRGEIEPDDPSMRHAFKTPTLRNIALRSPHMHDGSLADLEAVLAHYRSGGVDRPSRSALIHPLDLTERDVSDLIAFLETLTEEQLRAPMPALPAQ